MSNDGRGAIGRERHSCRAVAFVALVVPVLASACGRGAEAPIPEVRPVRVLITERGVIGEQVSLTGIVEAEAAINLSFRIDGRLVERTVGIGETVRRGQVVARLDPQNEETGVQAANAQLLAARAQMVEAGNNFVRMRNLVAEHAVSRVQFDQAQANRKVTESLVESAQSQVTLARNRLSYTQLVSNVAGIVTAQGAEPGEVVGAGQMIVARGSGRDAVFDVPERVKDFAPANVQITVVLVSDTTVTARGRVSEVSPRADPVTGTFRIKIRLINPPAGMRLGSTVTGRMMLSAAAGIELPASAVIRSGRQPAVWLVDPKTGTVSARNIIQRSSDADKVVVATGLKPGDVVVTAGVQALRPGQKVRLLESKK